MKKRVSHYKPKPFLSIEICLIYSVNFSCFSNINEVFSASLVMPNGDPRDGFFYPTLTLIIDSYFLFPREMIFCNSDSFSTLFLRFMERTN